MADIVDFLTFADQNIEKFLILKHSVVIRLLWSLEYFGETFIIIKITPFDILLFTDILNLF